ncbi:BT_3928 family protein [uncultured Porphyromonas sp.]|uniref:BT_3928 family protein n=1 Tax=uncultured Porphyromonas sp. TaxID=159274 RepID=UPI0025994EA3|nr:BT_3928 family protein [uncultured Porphyromonas sp.]
MRHRYSDHRPTTSPGLTLLVRLVQVLVGLFFIFSGCTKGIDPMGTGLKIMEYLGLWGMTIDLSLATYLAVGLNVLEALLGTFLLLGIGRRWTPVATLILMVPMTCLTLYIYIASPVADCGCFGDALKISNEATFWKNVVLLLLLILLVRHRDALYPLGSQRKQVVTGVMMALVLIVFNVYPILYLPTIDFRPYKVGTPISHFYDLPADDGMRYIYERGGEERALTTEELATVDSTWTYVRYEELAAKPALERESEADLILLDAQGEEVGHRFAATDAQALLYITYDIDRLSEEQLRLGLELQQRAHHPVTLVVTSPLDRLENHPRIDLIRRYGRILFMDLKMAQTLIRSNPGLVVIHDGVLSDKLSYVSLRFAVQDRHFIAHLFRHPQLTSILTE